MSTPIGRREAHKEATRAALRDAGARLFAERGYEATTVRDIARAAQVTERTFYRYFEGKEGLRAEETLGWIELLHDAIRDRPAQEPPFVAVQRAMLAIARKTAPADVGLAQFRRSADRPLRRLEDSIAAAVLARLDPEQSDADHAATARQSAAGRGPASGTHCRCRAADGRQPPSRPPGGRHCVPGDRAAAPRYLRDTCPRRAAAALTNRQEVKTQDGAAVRSLVDADAATVRVGDLLDDREPEARPGIPRAAPER